MKFTNFLDEQIRNVKLLNNREKLRGIEVNRTDRNEFDRDYARVIYSNAFKRLQGKMQLLPVDSISFSRNRLTHSLEVSQIAREIVELIKGRYKGNKISEKDFVDMTKVVEAAACLHDIGNPPFGHHGERILNELSKGEGFEGNAQGIRVIRKIEKKLPGVGGLNLTYRTQVAIIKYNRKYDGKCKKFLYKDDYEELNSMFSEKNVKLRTIDVQIIDLADEIAYCAHDLEDALARNYFTIDEFLYLLENSEHYLKFKEWVDEAKNFATDIKENKNKNYDYDFYFRRELISIIVHKLVKDIDIVTVRDSERIKTGTDWPEELGFKNYKNLVNGLKNTIFEGVTQSNEVKIYENVGTKVLTALYEMYSNEKYNPEGILMPVEFRWKKLSDKNRKILDYLSGMMDTYAIKTYENYFGESPFDKLYEKKYYTNRD